MSNFIHQHNSSSNLPKKKSNLAQDLKLLLISTRDNLHLLLRLFSQRSRITPRLNICTKTLELVEATQYNQLSNTMIDKNLSRLMIKRCKKLKKVYTSQKRTTQNTMRLFNGKLLQDLFHSLSRRSNHLSLTSHRK